MNTRFLSGPRVHKLKQALLSLALVSVVGVSQSGADSALYVGAAEGGGPRVSGYGVPSFSVFLNQFVFESDFRGGAAVAVAGDVNNDGVPDLFVGAGPGGGPRLSVLDGQALLRNQISRLADMYVADRDDRHGISVGVGDVNNDGFDDAYIGFRTGGAPFSGQVQVLSGERLRFGIHSLMFDQNVLGTIAVGTHVAGGDVDHDGYDDIIVGADSGGGPVVQILRGSSARSNSVSRMASFWALPVSFSGGVRVATGDVNGDGYEDVFTGPGAGGGPILTVWSGAYFALQNGSPIPLIQNACVFACDQRNGLYVGGKADLNGDNYAEVLVSNGGVVRVLSGLGISNGQVTDVFSPFIPFAGSNVGIWMTSTRRYACSNRLDDDGDGAIDLDDFSCQGNPRRDDESTLRAACDDDIDNDNDGLEDLSDPGCTSRQDNDEYNVPPTAVPTVRPTSTSTATPTATPIPQCTAMACTGGILVCPASAGGCPGGCGRVCVPNPTVTPTATPTRAPTSVAQPRPTRTATPAPNATRTRTPVPATPTPASTATPSSTIAPACINRVTVSLTPKLDEVAKALAEAANKAADDLFKIAKRQNGNLASAQRDVRRTKALANRLYIEATTLTLRFPTVSRTCPNLPPECREVDNGPTILALTKNYLESTNAVARILNRAGFRSASDTRKFKKTIREAKAIRKNGYDVLARLPLTAISCAN